jgi:uncharacterized alkaline shock family protein YloU
MDAQPSAEYTQGRTTVAPEVLLTIARLTALNAPGVCRLSEAPASVNRLFKRSTTGDGVQINIQGDVVSVELYLVLKNNVNIRDVSRQVQRNVSRAISEMVGMQVDRVNVYVEDIHYPEESRPEKEA